MQSLANRVMVSAFRQSQRSVIRIYSRVPEFRFSEDLRNFSILANELDKKGAQLGKGQFRQLYFPIKRIHFQNEQKFARIYLNEQSSMKNIQKSLRMSRIAYHLPFFGYYLNYLFVFTSHQTLHQITLAALLIAANAKSFHDQLQISRDLAEIYISQDGVQFIAVLPRFMFSKNINEFEDSLSESIFQKEQCQIFSFSLDEIENVQLLSQESQKVDESLISKIGFKKTSKVNPQQQANLNLQEQKKQILEKLTEINTNDEVLLLSISKEQWNCCRTFRIPLKNNKLTQFNDYFIALGFKQRIVMRESINPDVKSTQQKTQE